MLPNSEGKTLSGGQLLEFIEKRIAPKTTVMTDTFSGYRGVGKKYPHKTVNHSIGEYSRGNGVHINTIGISEDGVNWVDIAAPLGRNWRGIAYSAS